MQEFYHIRQLIQRKNMMKYLKYVLNDHFLLVMLISLGGFGLYYSEFVKTIDESFYLGTLFGILGCSLTIFFGKLATLIKEADSIFLLPKERAMADYLKISLRHSIVLPFIVIGLVTGVLMPILVATTTLDFAHFLPIVLNLWGLKLADLFIQLESLYLNTEKKVCLHTGLLVIISLLTMSINVLVMPWYGLGLTAVFLLFIYKTTQSSLANNPLNWDKAIQTERKRMKKIYSFINLFTDVPGLSAEVKRRKYFDGLLNKIKKEQGQTYTYLYSRVFLRGTEYSGLVFRLTIIGSLVLVFSDQLILSVIVSLLFIYLIGFQLLPIYNEFDYMLMTQLYPVNKSQKTDAVQKLILIILLVVAAIFSIVLVIRLENKLQALMISVALFAESTAFVYLYTNNRLKKLEKSLI